MHIADVSQEQQVKGMIEVVDRHGGLDVMVANAGITMARKPSTPIAEGAVSNHTIDVNARDTFICYKYARLRTVKQGRGGRIIGVCAVLGKQGELFDFLKTNNANSVVLKE
ncbi:hypothetical protein FB45DRAFT_753762 [Roridomyces roridus]|uniref:Uncharacterized protein n=1 Tax=Roridomyces roridus TaxID=1738132 RepID=A0AAD7BHT0_9AGAR|nr:hypothetical protein FB45DRAFT_753762 [Roridomyces roridus]